MANVELSQSDPSWKTIQEALSLAKNNPDPFLKRVSLYVDQIKRLEDLDPESQESQIFEDEWAVIHSIRILAQLQEDRLIPILFRILNELIDDWELEIVDTCFGALDALAKPEQFDVYWREYKRLESLGESVECQEFPDLEILAHYAHCHVPQPELVSELISRFDESPSQIANIMWELHDPVFLPTLERHLKEIAPIKKYVPFNRMKIVEHDEWIEVGSAWLELKRQNWNPSWDVQRRDMLKEYRDLSQENLKSAKEPAEDFLKQRDQDQAELAAKFLDPLPARFTAAMSSVIESVQRPSELNAKLAFYLNQGGKVGRNDPCPCGSGKKFKKCCWL